MKILVSSCLLGKNVKYSGGNNFSEELKNIIKKYDLEVVKVCPEVLGGLPIPRVPSEIKGNDIINKNQISVLKEFEKGALETLKIAKKNKVSIAILKEKSPSCGSKYIYDGSFSGNIISGQGCTTKKLLENNIRIFSEKELGEFIKYIK